MDWLHHPSYEAPRGRVVQLFRKRPLKFRPLPTIVFLCGSSDRTRRRAVEGYLTRSDPNRLVFYAEDAWAHVRQMRPRPPLHVMDMERQLAVVADVILIIVEGEGAIHELGAFSSTWETSTKILAIFDERRKNSGSFLEIGPVKEVNRLSRFQPVIFCDLDQILRSTQELDVRLARVKPPEAERLKSLALSDKQALFLLCDLLAIVGPAPVAHCKYYLSEILERPPWSIETLLALGVVCGLIEATNDSASLYSRSPREEKSAYLVRSGKPLNLSSRRAEVLSALARVPSTPHWFKPSTR